MQPGRSMQSPSPLQVTAAGRHGDAGAPVIDPAVALGLLTLGILLKDLPSLRHPELVPANLDTVPHVVIDYFIARKLSLEYTT